jgi:4-amino-4-deoxy-L-arabinose transferase-like glycosyltransferase
MGFGAYLRIWPIGLFKWISDYDEGAYSLGARFISEGYLPYRDFVLVHPPLYDLTLAGIYKLFGYDFFYGRYFSVFLFLVCVVLAYLIVRKMARTSAGLVAAALFSVFPALSSLWYRVVQEPLGIVLTLMAIWLATDHILDGTHSRRLVFSGLCLGLALTVKFTFAPAVVAFVAAILSLRMRQQPFRVKSFLSAVFNKESWFLMGGLGFGILLVTGFFLAISPHDFITQAVSSQLTYRVGGTFQGVVARISAAWSGTITDRINTYSLLVPMVVLAILLVGRRFSRSTWFMTIMLVVCLPLCAFFKPFGETRYFVSAYTVALLAIGTLTPTFVLQPATYRSVVESISRKPAMMILLLALILSTAGSTMLMWEYNYVGTGHLTYEEVAYRETQAFFGEVHPDLVYALNPIIPALYPEIPSTVAFDTFGMLQPMKMSPEGLVSEQVTRGVDYIVVDAFSWFMRLFHYDMERTVHEIRDRGTLVKTIIPGNLPALGVEIYAVGNH